MSKISGLTSLTTLASGDLLPVVDVSDTSMAATGTTKKVTAAGLLPVDWVNVVTQYGADPTGAADCSTAVNSALSAGFGKTIFFPAGTYKFTSQINPPVSAGVISGTCIRGSGWGTILTFDQSVVPTLIAFAGTTQGKCDIRDLQIQQSGAADGGTAIDCSYFIDSNIVNVSVNAGSGGKHCLTGIVGQQTGTEYNVISDCRISVAGTAAKGISLTTNANSNVIRNCRILAGTDAGSSAVYLAAHSNTIDHVDVEGGGGNAIFLDTGASATTIINPYSESNNIGLKITSGVVAPVMIGGTIQSSVTANIQDNGAVSPVFLGTWPNSSTLIGNVPLVVAATSTSGYTLVNGTGTVLTWTAPSDGALHRVFVPATLHVTSGATGGQINVSFTAPDGTAGTTALFSASHGAGVFGPDKTGEVIVQAGTAVSVTQATALTAGAAVLWAEIRGA